MKKIISFLTKKKWQLLIGAAFVLISFLTVLPRIKSVALPPEAKYETARVEKGEILTTVSASGTIEAENQATLKFQTAGLLNWVGVKEGDTIKKWQAIASLDKRELEKDLKKKLLAYMNERWDFEQTQEDYEVGGKPLGQVVNLTDAEKRILEKAQFDLDSVVVDVEIKDLVKKLATIYSPINGIVTEADPAVAGVNVTPTTAQYTVIDPSGMKFVANVDETDIGQVRLGQKAIITLDSYSEETFEGEVIKIAFAAITTSGGGTAFRVDISLPENINQKFRWGMNGDVEIVVAQETETLMVPTEALIEEDGKILAKVIEGRSIKTVEVETGIESETKTQITKGLTDGQLVITGEKKKEKR